MVNAVTILVALLLTVVPGLGFKLEWDQFYEHEYAVVNPRASGFSANGYTWYEGQDICKSNEAILLSIHSVTEVNFAGSNFVSPWRYSYWIGLHRLDNSEKWEWTTREVDFRGIGSNIGYGDRNKQCAVLKYNKKLSEHTFSAENCGKGRLNNRILGFICKRKIRLGDTFIHKKTQPRSISGECPEGWTEAGKGNDTNKCYKLFLVDKEITWKFAEGSCLSLPLNRPNLACANTQGEVNFLTELVKKARIERIWFGLLRESNRDRWIWADNSRMNVTNFHQFISETIDHGYGFIDNSATPSGSWDVSTENDGVRATTTSYACQIEKAEIQKHTEL
jgi:hypothetical protein